MAKLTNKRGKSCYLRGQFSAARCDARNSDLPSPLPSFQSLYDETKQLVLLLYNMGVEN